ncbi:MAG: HEAT repeat domain-containing protein [Verrucomicrobiota bacterium]
MTRTAALLLFALAVWADAASPSGFPQPRAPWKIELVASAPAVRHPSVVCAAPDGRVFVAEDPMDISAPANAAQGRIVCLHPNGRQTVFAENLYAVFGMQYLEGKLYVLHNPKFSVFTDANGVGQDRQDLIESTHPNPWALDWNDHVPANFKLAMDGFFYVAVGDKGIFGAVGRDGKRLDLHGGGVIRMRPNGTQIEVYCRGIRNILDVALNSEDEIFTYDNTDEQQWMGRLTHMVDGGFYGYPYDFIPRRPYTLWMMADFGGGAATGAFAYDDDALPPEYRDNLFLADFGKRQVMRVRIEREGGTYRVLSNEDLIPDPPEDFRPVGIAPGADGASIYICDWQHRDVKANVTVGRLWKLSYPANLTQSTPRPDWYLPAAMGQPIAASDSHLIAALSHPSKKVRLTAQRRLTDRAASGRKEIVRELQSLFGNRSAASHARWHALWALHTIDPKVAGRIAMGEVSADSDATVRRQAARQLGESSNASALVPLQQALEDRELSVRFAAATALGRIANRSAIPALVTALNETDLFTRYAVFTALNRIGRSDSTAWPDLVRHLAHDLPAIREGIELALRETYNPVLADELIDAATDKKSPKSNPSPAQRSGENAELARVMATRLVAALHHKTPEWKGEWWAYHPVNSPPPIKSVPWERTPKILKCLRQLLPDSNPQVRLAALAGIREAKDTEATVEVCALFERETDPEIKRAALTTLGAIRDQRAEPLLLSLLRNSETPPTLMAEAIAAARQLRGKPLGAAIVRLLSTRPSDENIVLQALETLRELKMIDGFESVRAYANHPNTALRSAALDALVQIDSERAFTEIAPLIDHESVEVQRSAVQALGRLKKKEAVPQLLKAFERPATRGEAMLALANIPDARAIEAYLQGLIEPNPAVREASRKALQSLRDDAWPKIEPRLANLPSAMIQELRKIYEKDARASASLNTVPKAPSPEDYLDHALKAAGDAMMGRSLFYDLSKLACVKCHVVGKDGGRIGPELTTVGAQFSKRELAESILFPSRAVREGYQAVNIELRDGESLSGLFKGETADELSLLDSEGRLHRLRKAEIRSRRLSDLSMMPEGLHAVLSLEEFASLVAYLASLKK